MFKSFYTFTFRCASWDLSSSWNKSTQSLYFLCHANQLKTRSHNNFYVDIRLSEPRLVAPDSVHLVAGSLLTAGADRSRSRIIPTPAPRAACKHSSDSDVQTLPGHQHRARDIWHPLINLVWAEVTHLLCWTRRGIIFSIQHPAPALLDLHLFLLLLLWYSVKSERSIIQLFQPRIQAKGLFMGKRIWGYII